ncbi:protein-export chaperone SecB [Hwanghaeella grinnelliae]|uniref:Protein-export protein SecB n=1 Tax=Hwanghaeella grinnelliae TaxID=2500179 RepID=A0A3S2Y2K6_9PROT|nr:protein-export chaperone SecB [Hwanghaeella grinnelliae]RVU36232.1 protein-export chaperone SecB [Hwanghaeella grinnelliae]
MSDTEDQTAPTGDAAGANPDNQAAPGNPQQPPLTIVHQYLKDLSFENPSTPKLQVAPGVQPSVDVKVDVTATALDEKVFEVSLHTTFKTTANEHVIYMGELVYACVAHLGNVRQQDMEPLLLIEVPRLLFPYSRAIISNATRDGGFQPLILTPFDFVALYRKRLESRAAQTSTETGTA